MTIFLKLPPNSGHLPITDKFLKTHRCPLFWCFTVIEIHSEFRNKHTNKCLNFRVVTLRVCLHVSQDGIKNETGRFFFPPIYLDLFQPGRDKYALWKWFLSRLPERGIKQVIAKHFLRVKIMKETSLPNSTFKIRNSFQKFSCFVCQKNDCFRTQISYQKSSHAGLFLMSASVELIRIFWKHCCHVRRVLKKSHWKRSFLVTFFVCYCEFMYRYFNMFVNFGRTFFSSSSG